VSPIVQAFLAGMAACLFLIGGIIAAIYFVRDARDGRALHNAVDRTADVPTARWLRKHHERARRELLGSVLSRVR
jgi:hypothetical protein